MQKIPMVCPVCGTINMKTTYSEDIGGYYDVVESIYECKICSYFEKFCYGQSIKGVVRGKFAGFEKEINELGLKVWSEREVEDYLWF